MTEKLGEWFPDCMPELIAIDPSRGWVLMRDGGEQLRASIRPSKDVRPWAPVITRYAQLQLALTSRVDELLALGIPDRCPAALPSLFEKLLSDKPSLMIGQEKGLTSAEAEQLHNLNSRFQQICSDLSTLGIPNSLNHGDFHDGNVLVRDGRITLFDWGDASITHPFVSLRTFFVSMEIALNLEDYAPPTPEMSALLSLYLERWQGFADSDSVRRAYNLSRPVASIVSARSWYQGISNMEEPLRSEYAWIVPELLREFMVYERTVAK